MISGGGDGIFLWNVKTHKQLGRIDSPAQSLALSPDGNILVLGYYQIVTLWDTKTQSQLGSALIGHSGAVNDFAFSPDGKMLASGGSDKTITIWDVSTRLRIGSPLVGHTKDLNSLAFSPDGKILASASSDNTIMLWDMSFQAWRQRACRIANRNLTRKEWGQFLEDEPYRKTCSELPWPEE